MSQSDVKSLLRFLTCWRPITSIIVIIERNSWNKFNSNYLQKWKHFLEVLLHFWNINKVLKVLEKKKSSSSIRRFWNVMSPKNVVTSIHESSSLRTHFESQSVKWSETLLKCVPQNFDATFPLISNKLSCVSCPLIQSEISGLLFNTLTANHIYSCHNWQKLPQQLQTQLSSKPSTFPERFFTFPKST